MSGQITDQDLKSWWDFASSYNSTEHPFKQDGGAFLSRHQPSDLLCLTCTGDRDPCTFPTEVRKLPAANNKPILIPVFVAGASDPKKALEELGDNVRWFLLIDNQAVNPVWKHSVVHNIAFKDANPFNEPAENNSDYYTVGFWYKIPAEHADSVKFISFGGSSSFSTSVIYIKS